MVDFSNFITSVLNLSCTERVFSYKSHIPGVSEVRISNGLGQILIMFAFPSRMKYVLADIWQCHNMKINVCILSCSVHCTFVCCFVPVKFA
jgi:hypothetical protein